MRWMTRIAVSLLVLTALMTSLARYALPAWIEQHREEFIVRLGEVVHGGVFRRGSFALHYWFPK